MLLVDSNSLQMDLYQLERAAMDYQQMTPVVPAGIVAQAELTTLVDFGPT